MTTTAPLEWHPILGKWTIGQPSIETEPARLVNTKAWFTNALSFGFSSSQPVVFTLEDAATGALVQERVGRTGSATPITGDTSETVVFRRVPPGSYLLRVAVQDLAGHSLDETTRAIQIVPSPEP